MVYNNIFLMKKSKTVNSFYNYFMENIINNELYHTTNNVSILRPVSSLLGLIRQAKPRENAV